jgi:3-oxoacyl-[acyl-carrier protein] reductase
MDLGLTGKVALITGSGRGIGRAIALKLADEGASIAVNDIIADTAESTVLDIRGRGGRAESFVADVSDFSEVEHMVDRIEDSFHRLDILINNAGISIPAAIQAMSLDQWNKVIEVNLHGVFLCSKAVFPLMVEQGWGRIITLASFAGKRGTLFGDNTSYSTSKSAVMGFTVSLAYEAAKHNITVNAVAPGIVKTDLLLALPEEKQLELADYPLLKRLASPEEIAHVVAFLASDLASYITGEVIDVNGGLYLDL